MVEVEKLVALLQSGALDKKSLVLKPSARMDMEEVGQAFFRDVGLIEAVQAAENPESSLRVAADRIREAVYGLSVGVWREFFSPECEHAWRAKQVEKYLAAYHSATEARAMGLHKELPDPEKFLNWQVIQDLAAREVVEAFKVVEVTGPAVVRLECDHNGPYWEVKSLREELIKLMRQMESK